MGRKGALDKREAIEKILIYGVFICYIALLIKMLFLSRVSLSGLFDSQREINRSVNLIPFFTIKGYLFTSYADIRRFAFANVMGNIAIFIPLGAYLPLLRKNKKLMINLLIIFAASLFTEIIQGLLGIGASDIDDIILNCLGGLAGILGYKLLLILLRDEKRVRTAMAILSLMGMHIIYYLLFIIKMRF